MAESKMRLSKKRRRSLSSFASSGEPKKLKAGKIIKSVMTTPSFQIILPKVDENIHAALPVNVPRQLAEDLPILLHSPKLTLHRIDSSIRTDVDDDITGSLIINSNGRNLLPGSSDGSVSQIQFTSVHTPSVCNKFNEIETVTSHSVVSVRSKSVYVSANRITDYMLSNRPKNGPDTILKDVKNVRSAVEASPGEFINAKNKLKPYRGERENTRHDEKLPRGRKPNTKLVPIGCSSRKLSSSFLERNNYGAYKLVVRLHKLGENEDRSSHHRRISEEEFIEATSITAHLCDYAKREIKKNVRIQKTVGIDVRSNEMGCHRNRTEIIQGYYTKRVKDIFVSNCGQNAGSKSATPIAGVMTRRTAAIAASQNKENRKNDKKPKKNLNVSFKTPNDEEEYESDGMAGYSNPSCYKTENMTQVTRLSKETRNVKQSPAKELRIEKNSASGRNSKNLNVSFKTEEDHDELVDRMPIAFRLRKNRSSSRANYKDSSSETKTSSSRAVSTPTNVRESIVFRGFDDSVDHTSGNIGLCSYIMHSLDESAKKLRTKRRMTKAEAANRTELVNLCKKAAERDLGRARKSNRLALKKIRKALTANSSPTAGPKSSSLGMKKQSTPFVVLSKLNETDISSYKITPLREDRWPLPSKTADDYGIDDVNTDDSTDDEEVPKKCLPQWVHQVRLNLAARYTPQDFIPADQIRLWMKPPKYRYSLKNVLFK